MIDPYLEAFVKRGKNRITVLKELSKHESMTQAELHHATDLYRTHVRRTLLELEEKGLVKCLNPKDRIHKMYVITSLAKNLI